MKKVSLYRLCDRCAHPFDESTVKYGDELPKFAEKVLTLVLVAGATPNPVAENLFRFEDLCPDCDRVVEGYIKKIRLEPEEDSPKKKRKAEKVEDKPSDPTTQMPQPVEPAPVEASDTKKPEDQGDGLPF